MSSFKFYKYKLGGHKTKQNKFHDILETLGARHNKRLNFTGTKSGSETFYHSL